MSYQYVGGPSEIYVHTGAVFQFLGYSESGVRINWIRHFENTMTDKAGTMMPADKQFMGYEALISADLTQFNYSVLDAYVRPTIRLSAVGEMDFGTLGQLMLQQNNTYRLNIRQPYANPAVWSGSNNTNPFPGLIENFHFLHAFLLDESEPVGTKRKVIPIVWYAMTYVNPATGIGTFVDSDPGSLPSPN